MRALKGKTLLITGGTGSFGSTVLRHFLRSEIAEIRIFSRDEKKQDDMRHRLQERCPELAGRVRTASSTRPRSSRCPLASSSPWRRSRPT